MRSSTDRPRMCVVWMHMRSAGNSYGMFLLCTKSQTLLHLAIWAHAGRYLEGFESLRRKD